SLTLTSGAVSGTTSSLPGGAYNVRAHYAGDATFAASDSAAVPITVTAEGSTTLLSVFSVDPSGNLLPYTSQPYGTPAYLTADVAGVSGHGSATGSVLFTDNGTNIVGDPYSLNSEGKAATAQGVFSLPAGQHSIVASYNGDTSFNASASAGVNISVTQAATTAGVASSSSSVVQGGLVTLTAIISTVSGGLRPSGTVTFLSGGTPIANAGNPASVAGTDGSGNVQNGAFHAAQGLATLVIDLPAGQDSITAQYSGDPNYIASTSSATVVTVQPDFAFAAAIPSLTIAN